MPRKPRVKSESHFYHVMLRGINHQNIFEDTSDKYKFLEILTAVKGELGFKLISYCLMDNHVHLLISEDNDDLSSIFRKINTTYVIYFNQKYSRVGHLFQDRYKTEIIKNDAQLIQTVRYIHNNPVKGGLCAQPIDYRFSSYKDYLSNGDSICDKSLVLGILGSVDGFKEFSGCKADYKCMDLDEVRPSIGIDAARLIIQKEFPGANAQFFQSISKQERNRCIAILRGHNLSINQINRLTGISIGVIQRIKADDTSEF